MEFKIKTLTPVWTGDVERNSTKLRETSIIGSLRWWFEAVVRGLGGYACDSVSNGCEYKDNTNSICPVCELFGTTGWAKRFRFEVNQSFREIHKDNLVIKGNKRNWYYPGGLLSCDGEFNKIRQTLSFEKDVSAIFRVLFAFISKWGMVGGKTAIGYGVVRFEEKDKTKISLTGNELDEFLNFVKKQTEKSAENAPKLSEMFFAKFKIADEYVDDVIRKIEDNVNVKNDEKQFPKSVFKCNGTENDVDNVEVFLQNLKNYYGFLPTSALVRRELRKKIGEKWSRNHKLRHFLMGNVQMRRNLQELGPTRFSAIQISHIYRDEKEWELRIWGWVPRDIQSKYGVNRIYVMNFIVQTLNDKSFWDNVFKKFCFLEKLGEDKIIVEYPDTNWNFIDFGGLNKDEIEEVFKKILLGDENE